MFIITKKQLLTFFEIIIALGILVAFSFSINSAFKIDSKEEVRKVINQFFNNSLESYKSLKLMDFNNIIEDNDNTYLFKKLIETQIEFYKVTNSGYSWYDYNIEHRSISLSNLKAEVTLNMHLKFQYRHSRDNIESASSTKYKFVLKKSNNKWVISDISTDLLEFRLFKKSVEDTMIDNPNLSIRNAIDYVKKEWVLWMVYINPI